MEPCNYCSKGFPQTFIKYLETDNKGCMRMESTGTSIDFRIAGVVLAGGQSRRIGSPKEGLRLWDGRPMIEHIIEALRVVCPDIIVVGKCSGHELDPAAGIHHVADLRPGLGPLAGIESALSSGITHGYVILACDQPLVTPQILEKLLTGDPSHIHIFADDGSDRIEPFPGYYPVECLTLVQDRLDNGERSIRSVINSFPTIRILLCGQEISLLKNVNTLADLDSIMTAAAEALDEEPTRR